MNVVLMQGPDMFGASDSSPEPGNAIFQDGQATGFVHWVEWETPSETVARSFHLFAAHDSPGLNRSFDAFRLYGYDSSAESFELLYEFFPTLPYGGDTGGNTLLLCGSLEARTLTRFRAEFVQSGLGVTWPGPRIYELDAFSTPIRTVSVAADDPPQLPDAIAFGAPYPNPFRGRAVLPYELDRPGHVRLAVFDVLGREVAVLANGERASGRHEAAFDAADLSGGVYLVRLTTGSSTGTRLLTLVR